MIKSRDYIILAVILMGSYLMLGGVLDNEFTNWDDHDYVVENEDIKQLNLRTISSFFSENYVGLYTPLTLVSFAVDYQLFGLDPTGFHLTSLIVHLLNTALVYLLILTLFHSRAMSIVVAVFFSIHPLNIETVAWISSRKDLLFVLFYLLSLLAYISYKKNGKLLWIVLSFVCFILSGLSKPTALTLPLVLILIDYVKDTQISLRHFVNKLHFFLVSAALFIVGLISALKVNPFNVKPFGYNFIEEVILALYSLGYYVYHAIFPHQLTNFHAYPYNDNSWIGAEYWIGAIFFMGFIALLIYFRKKEKKYLFALLFFLITILPVFRIAPTGFPIVSERYFYLSSVGIIAFISFWVINHWNIFFVRLMTVFSASLLIVWFIKLDLQRIRDWETSISLWSKTVEVNPDIYLAQMKLGDAYAARGNERLALQAYQNSLMIYDENAPLFNQLGNMYFDQNDYEIAVDFFTKAIRLDSTNATYYYNRGNTYKALNTFDSALFDYNNAIKISPIPGAYNNRGLVNIFTGDSVRALQDLDSAVLLEPGNKVYRDNYERLKKLLDN